jgi:hypothetical protein
MFLLVDGYTGIWDNEDADDLVTGGGGQVVPLHSFKPVI